MQHILFLTFHLRCRVCRIFLSHSPTAFCFICVFVMDISSLPSSSPPHPKPESFLNIPGRAQLFSCGLQQSPWGLSYQSSAHDPLCISHGLQGQKPESSQRRKNHRAATERMDHLTCGQPELRTTSPPLSLFPNDSGF